MLFRSESAAPSRDWLQFVESPRARNKIKQWFSRERRDDMIEAGREELTKEFRREGLPVQRIWASEALAAEFEAASYADLDSLLAAVGEGHVVARSFAGKVARRLRDDPEVEDLPADRFSLTQPRRQRKIGRAHV